MKGRRKLIKRFPAKSVRLVVKCRRTGDSIVVVEESLPSVGPFVHAADASWPIDDVPDRISAPCTCGDAVHEVHMRRLISELSHATDRVTIRVP